jgi:hypothetical protein
MVSKQENTSARRDGKLISERAGHHGRIVLESQGPDKSATEAGCLTFSH